MIRENYSKFDKKNVDFEDLYEIEKTKEKEHEFFDFQPKPLKKKREIVDFQEIDKVYKKRKFGDSPFDQIKMYSPIVVIEIWIFTIILFILSISGIFLLRDWLFSTFGVYGNIIIPTPYDTRNIHLWFGLALGIAGLFHILFHIFSKNFDIIPKQTFKDFKSFLHSGLYLIGFTRREDFCVDRFYGRQKIVYTALIYILGLSFFTGILQYVNFLSDDLAFVHVVPGGLALMVLLFHFLVTIRKHDLTGLNCAFFSGKLPRMYIRKNHPLWYQIIKGYQSNIDDVPQHLKSQIDEILNYGDDISKAVLKFVLLVNDSPDILDLKAYIRDLKLKLDHNTLQRIIELSEELDEENSGKNKIKLAAEHQPTSQ